MRISDWSSDVCSSDLITERTDALEAAQRARPRRGFGNEPDLLETGILHRIDDPADALVRRVDVAADMHFGEILFGNILRAADILEQLFRLVLAHFEQLARIDRRLAPEDRKSTRLN